MAKDRARDDRRSVGSFEKMKGALGNATGWLSTPIEGGTRFAVNQNTGKKASSPDANFFVPGKANIKVGKARTEHSSGNTVIRNDKPYSEFEGTAGISGKTEPAKRGKDWVEVPRNVDLDKDLK